MLLRTIQLNWVGWAALAGGGFVVGALGALVGTALGLPGPPVGAAAVLLALATFLVLDLLTWRNGQTYTGPWHETNAEELESTATRLRGMGYDVTMDSTTQEEPTLLVRNRDLKRINNLLR